MVKQPKSVAERILAVRTKSGLSQNALAVKAGLHPSSVSRIETGRHVPTLETLRSLARALDVKLDTLAG